MIPTRLPRLVLLLVLTAVAWPLHAQSDFPTLESVQLSPQLPTAADEVTVLVRSNTGPGCTYFEFPEQASPSPLAITPRPIIVQGTVQTIHVLCVGGPFQHEIRLGRLDPGSYRLQLYADPGGDPPANVLLHTLDFAVSPASDRVELHNGSFVAFAEWIGGPAAGQPLHAVTLGKESGYFWSFGSTNVELTVKLLDGGLVNDQFWLFLAPMSSLGLEVTVYDRRNGCTLPACPQRTYTLAPGQPDTLFDVNAFFSEQ
jgi:hypothetical protein